MIHKVNMSYGVCTGNVISYRTWCNRVASRIIRDGKAYKWLPSVSDQWENVTCKVCLKNKEKYKKEN